MPSHTYYFESEEEIEVEMTSPAQAPTGPSFSDPGEPGYPAEWETTSFTILGIPCYLGPQKIAAALWPTNEESQKKFISCYLIREEAAVEDAAQNYEPDYE